jgi:spermidine/putrescine transport system ATP-binding protein
MSDRIAVMRDGLVLQTGGPKDIYDNPSCRFVADFIGETNLIPGGMLGRPDAVTVAIRPERVSIAPDGRKPAGRLRGTIASATFLGLDTLYEVAVQPGIRIRARLRDGGETLAKGDAVSLDWPADLERELLD